MGVVYWILTKGATCDIPLALRVVCCHGNHHWHVNPDGQNIHYIQFLIVHVQHNH